MAKKRALGRYPMAFRKMAVERLKRCDHVVALSQELGVSSLEISASRPGRDTAPESFQLIAARSNARKAMPEQGSLLLPGWPTSHTYSVLQISRHS